MSFYPGSCGTAYVKTELETVVEYVCTLDSHDSMTDHLWRVIDRRPRCATRMNGYRCELWDNHGSDCHSKDLMFALIGEPIYRNQNGDVLYAGEQEPDG